MKDPATPSPNTSDTGTNSKRHILVSGDVVIDHHLYEGERSTPTVNNGRGVIEKRQAGGANSVALLLESLIKNVCSSQEKARQAEQAKRVKNEPHAEIPPAPEESWQVTLGIIPPPKDAEPCGHHSFAIWKPYSYQTPAPDKPAAGPIKQVWRASLLLGYGHDETNAGTGSAGALPSHCSSHAPQALLNPPAADILILDDAGFIFRDESHQKCWLLPAAGADLRPWIIHKMASPIATGHLWQALIKNHADELIVIVSAQDLRRESALITKGLSWESTVEGLLCALHQHETLRALTKCRHLVVTFSVGGALWLARETQTHSQATLIFDPARAEGEWAEQYPGEAFGYLSCMTAAVARALMAALGQASSPGQVRLELGEAISVGLATMRNLREKGHGPVIGELPTGFPHARLAASLLSPEYFFSRSAVPPPPEMARKKGTGWTILENSQALAGPSLLGLARRVVLHGKIAFASLPHAQFGDLVTVDRGEMEALRTLRHQLVAHRDDRKINKPLSIGVFGPPGAGKSFGVREISKLIFGKEAWLEFNLSQFKDSTDLLGAFHKIRDLVLGGVTPVAFWDEFDSRDFYWLQYLLAPMQDGHFQEGQLNHAVGKCVFILAGGTSDTYEAFGEPATDPKEAARRKALKVPDFHSRLDGYYNVTGPNQRMLSEGPQSAPDPSDLTFHIRRALQIANALPPPFGAPLGIDPGLLRALLEVPRYSHGSRSLNKLLDYLKISGEPSIMRSSLPSSGIIDMHTSSLDRKPGHVFQNLLDPAPAPPVAGVELLEPEREKLAARIHDAWQRLNRARGYPMRPEFDKPYDELDPVQKNENRAAAKRIPEVLRTVGLILAKIEPGQQAETSDDRAARDYLEHHLELLAEAEHNGWMKHRFASGWRYGQKRDDAAKLHPSLVPYQSLEHPDREKDRNTVRLFQPMLRDAGYRIVFAR